MEQRKFNIRITKASLVYEQNNDMVHNYYYLINFRLENKEKRTYCPLKMVQWIDIETVLEYYDKETVSNKEILNLAKECAFRSIVSRISDFYQRKELLNYCNDTIKDFNSIMN